MQKLVKVVNGVVHVFRKGYWVANPSSLTALERKLLKEVEQRDA